MSPSNPEHPEPQQPAEAPLTLKGWRLDGTDKWWPAMFGQPGWGRGLVWVPIYKEKRDA